MDETKGVQFNENSALVVLNVAHFAAAADANPSRVEVWSFGPQTYDATGTLQPGFNTGRATWQPYVSDTWFDRDANNEKAWFIGDYPAMANGRVRVTVWTSIPSKSRTGRRTCRRARSASARTRRPSRACRRSWTSRTTG